MQALVTAAREAKEALSSVGSGASLSGLTRAVNSLREALFSVKTSAQEFGTTATEAAGAAGRAADAASGQVNGLGAAFARAKTEAEAFRSEVSRPYEMVIQRVGGAGGGGMVPGAEDPDVFGPIPRRQIGRDPGTIDGEFQEVFNRQLLLAGGGGGYGGGWSNMPFGGGYGGTYGSGGGGAPALSGGGMGPPNRPGVPMTGYGWGPNKPAGGFHGIGLGEMVEGDLVYHAVHDAMDESLSVRRAELSLGLPTDGPGEAAESETLRAIARTAAQGTIFSERQTAAAMPVLAREFGFKGQEGLDKFGSIFPTALRSAEVADMEKLGGLDETLSANVEYAHMTGRYAPKDLEQGLNTLQAVATATNQSPHSEESILKYSVPIGIAAGIGADQTAVATGFLQQQGFNSSTAGTGLSALMLGALDTGGGMNAQHRARVNAAEESLSHALGLTTAQRHAERAERSGTAHQLALQALGVTDSKNHLRAVDSNGNLDLGVLQQDIYDYSRTHTHQQTLSELHGAFGTRGERVAAIYTEDGAIGRQENFRRAIAATPGAVAQQQALADTPMQHFEQMVARASDLFNTMATATLPALNTAFQGLTSVIGGANAYLEHHDDAAGGGALAIGSLVGGQILRAGAWAARKVGATGMAARLGGLAELGPIGEVAGVGLIASDLAKSAFSWGEDAIFGKGTSAHDQELQTNLAHQNGGILGSFLNLFSPSASGATTGHTSAIDLINRAHPGMAPTSLAGSAAPVTTNSNNTTTISVGGISVTVNAPPGAGAMAIGESIGSAVVNALRNHLMTSSGPGAGISSAPATVGAHS